MYDQLIIVGNLGGEPEMRYTPDGTAVTNFSVAVNRKWGGENAGEQTIWFRVTAWGKLGEICNEYLTKGRQVMVVGQIQADKETGGPRIYERNDGSYGASFEVRATSVNFLGGREETGEASPKKVAIERNIVSDEVF